MQLNLFKKKKSRTNCENFLTSSIEYLTRCPGHSGGGSCAYRSPEEPGLLSSQDCLSSGKDEKPVLPSRKFTVGSEERPGDLSVLSVLPGRIKLQK